MRDEIQGAVVESGAASVPLSLPVNPRARVVNSPRAGAPKIPCISPCRQSDRHPAPLPMITLYDHPRSGNCYKVRLFLALIALPYRREFMDVLARKNQTEAFERISAWRQVPAIDDEGLAVWDSHAILMYLAQKHAPQWLAPLPHSAQMHAWL